MCPFKLHAQGLMSVRAHRPCAALSLLTLVVWLLAGVVLCAVCLIGQGCTVSLQTFEVRPELLHHPVHSQPRADL